MLNLLIATHGDFGRDLLESAQNLMGQQSGVLALALEPGQGREDLEEQMMKVLADLDEGQGVLILVDLMGGTPFNVAVGMIAEKKIEVVTGLSLPLLLEALSLRVAGNYQTVAAQLVVKAPTYVVLASQRIHERKG